MTNQHPRRQLALARRPPSNHIFAAAITLPALVIALALPAASGAATRTFTPVADAYTRSDEPNVNHGDGRRLTARGHDDQVRKTYMRFNVSVPEGKTITSARLELSVGGPRALLLCSRRRSAWARVISDPSLGVSAERDVPEVDDPMSRVTCTE